MNEAGRSALRQAALDGVRQITGRLLDEDGGYCAAGVLANAAPSACLSWKDDYDITAESVKCSICDVTVDEFALLVHGNDDHHLGFLKLAEFMPVSEIAP
jgi:hypothetical protein